MEPQPPPEITLLLQLQVKAHLADMILICSKHVDMQT